MTRQQISRQQDRALTIAYQECVERLAAIQHALATIQYQDPTAYELLYDETMTPAIVESKDAIGQALFAAAMRDAIALAKLALEPAVREETTMASTLAGQYHICLFSGTRRGVCGELSPDGLAALHDLIPDDAAFDSYQEWQTTDPTDGTVSHLVTRWQWADTDDRPGGAVYISRWDA